MENRNEKINKIIFYVLLAFVVSFLIIGITLVAIGVGDYQTFVKQTIDQAKTKVNIVVFLYGLFFLVLTFLLAVVEGLLANSLFNKKLK
ncbi:hypothetical protein [Mesomycoplasma molare]|uniref:Uncharacterized protein n=1 Tax=Mesomycoplasma molare TaxID=171288 RepID=A0ABY5TUN0_9BACT|nr:hypothetical protein [Mesomycoplasma molare]UWD34355.1 hypothetical protein NX772_00805 [Mesomycoplasma molare]